MQTLFASSILVLVGVGSLLFQVSSPIFLTAYTEHLDLTELLSGRLIGAEMTGIAIGTIGVALNIHRWNRRRVVCWGLFILILANVTSIGLTSFNWLVVARIAAGLGAGIAATAMFVSIAAMTGADRIFGAYNFAILGVSAAGISVSPLLLSTLGVDGLFIMMAVAALLPCLMIKWYPEPKQVPNQASTLSGETNLPKKTLFFVLVANFVYFIATGGLWPFLAAIGKDAGFSMDQIADVLASSLLTGMLGATIPMVLGSRIGHFVPLAVGLSVSIACTFALIGHHDSYDVYAVSVRTFTFTSIVFFPYLMGFMSRVDRSGRLVGMSLGAQSIAFGVGPLVAAQLFEFGRASWILVFASGSYILTAIILLPIVRRAATLSPVTP